MRRFAPFLRLACALLLLAGKTPAVAAPTEAMVKAAFLPRFARYVTWPPAARPGATEPIVLCTIGSDPFGPLLEQSVRSQGVDGHRIIVRRHASAANARGCHVAFVGGSSDQPTGQLLASLARQPVLTVTDSRTGSQRGIIHFAMDRGRVRFFIDEAAASQRGLGISSRLLGLAIAVRTR